MERRRLLCEVCEMQETNPVSMETDLSEWVLAVYENVLETNDTPREECKKRPKQKELPTAIKFKKARTEIEVW